jgi:hypothetical protein
MTNLELLNKIPWIHSSDTGFKFSRFCVERALMHAESVLKLIPKNEHRPADCCALVRKWANGEAVSFSQLTSAANAAANVANAAANAANAANAAANAANAAANVANAATNASYAAANASYSVSYAAAKTANAANAAANAAYAAEKQQQECWLAANMREALIAWGDDVLGPSMGLLYMCEDASGNTLLLEIGNAACD